MNLQEQLHRIQEMMGLINEEINPMINTSNEPNEKNKSKKAVELTIESEGILFAINQLELETIVNILGLSRTKELLNEYNPFEFIDEDFKKSIEDTIEEKIKNDRWIKLWKGSTKEEIFTFLITIGIDANHYQLINGLDWKIPKTDELLELIYGDWLKQHEGYKTLISLIKSK